MSAPSSSTSTTTPAETAALQAELKNRLIESGEYNKLRDVLKARLDEAGWEDSLRALAREKARAQEPPSLDGLVKDVEPQALDAIPVDIRKEITSMIQSFVEKNVEK